jgi:hypothetical protein
VEVDDDDGRLPQSLLEQALGHEKGILERVQRQLAEEVDDGDAVVDNEAAAGGARRQVRGAQDTVRAAQVGREALLPPHPVAERDHVGAGGEETLRDLGGDPAAVGRVLAVDDAEVGSELNSQGGKS